MRLEPRNVTNLWTVNIINERQRGRIPRPAPWWLGSSYVNCVGIDGYYLKPSSNFVPLSGSGVVRAVNSGPILIAINNRNQDFRVNTLRLASRSASPPRPIPGWCHEHLTAPDGAGHQVGITPSEQEYSRRKGKGDISRAHSR